MDKSGRLCIVGKIIKAWNVEKLNSQKLRLQWDSEANRKGRYEKCWFPAQSNTYKHIFKIHWKSADVQYVGMQRRSQI